MQNYFNMQEAFEKEKNIKALTYTGTVCVLVFIIFFFVQWQLPVIPKPAFEEGIEVNLGNSDQGMGDIEPMVPGDPSDEAEQISTPPATSQAVPEVQSIAGDENESDDAPVVNNVPKTVSKPVVPPSNPVVNRARNNSAPATNPTPPQQAGTTPG